MHSVAEAAARLGLTDRHIRFLLRKGELSGRKLGHDWVVLSLDYSRKRKPKKRARDEAAWDVLAQKPDDVWTEGSL